MITFIEICKDELDEKYFLHCNKTDPTYWLPFAKIRINNTIFDEPSIVNIDVHKGIFIDIFPLDNAKKQISFIQRIQALLSKLLYSVIILKRGLIINNRNIALQKTVLFLTAPFSIKSLSKLRQSIFAWYKNFDSEYFTSLGSRYSYFKQTVPKNKYYPISTIEFEGETYNAPNDYDYVLDRVYGNYMQIPPKEERVTHNPVNLDFGDE